MDDKDRVWVAEVLYDSYGHFVEWYSDDDGASGNGGDVKMAYWYGTREDCIAVSGFDPPPGSVVGVTRTSKSDPFDLACERRFD
jgi:hypothetical protein